MHIDMEKGLARETVKSILENKGTVCRKNLVTVVGKEREDRKYVEGTSKHNTGKERNELSVRKDGEKEKRKNTSKQF